MKKEIVIGIQFVTTQVVASECGVCKATVLRWIEKGHLKSLKLPSGQNRILKEELERFKKSLGI
jgi:excisionase family DNA binding protein